MKKNSSSYFFLKYFLVYDEIIIKCIHATVNEQVQFNIYAQL